MFREALKGVVEGTEGGIAVGAVIRQAEQVSPTSRLVSAYRWGLVFGRITPIPSFAKEPLMPSPQGPGLVHCTNPS